MHMQKSPIIGKKDILGRLTRFWRAAQRSCAMVFTNAFLVTIFALPRHRSVNSLDMADDKFPVKTIVLMALEHAVVETEAKSPPLRRHPPMLPEKERRRVHRLLERGVHGVGAELSPHDPVRFSDEPNHTLHADQVAAIRNLLDSAGDMPPEVPQPIGYDIRRPNSTNSTPDTAPCIPGEDIAGVPCALWATQGECEHIPVFMRSNCAASCPCPTSTSVPGSSQLSNKVPICKPWCPAHTARLDVKCAFPQCSTCAECDALNLNAPAAVDGPTTLTSPDSIGGSCKPWCAAHTARMEVKCAFPGCSTCAECDALNLNAPTKFDEPIPAAVLETDTCKSWCAEHTAALEVKCTYVPCSTCAECAAINRLIDPNPPKHFPILPSSRSGDDEPSLPTTAPTTSAVPEPAPAATTAPAPSIRPTPSTAPAPAIAAKPDAPVIETEPDAAAVPFIAIEAPALPSSPATVPSTTARCKPWCAAHTARLEVKCAFPGCSTCAGCDALNLNAPIADHEPKQVKDDEPISTDGCMAWCAEHTAALETKCTFGPCNQCAGCESLSALVTAPTTPTSIDGCMAWCPAHTAALEVKCTYVPCMQCAVCESLDIPSTADAPTSISPISSTSPTWRNMMDGCMPWCTFEGMCNFAACMQCEACGGPALSLDAPTADEEPTSGDTAPVEHDAAKLDPMLLPTLHKILDPGTTLHETLGGCDPAWCFPDVQWGKCTIPQCKRCAECELPPAPPSRIPRPSTLPSTLPSPVSSPVSSLGCAPWCVAHTAALEVKCNFIPCKQCAGCESLYTPSKADELASSDLPTHRLFIPGHWPSPVRKRYSARDDKRSHLASDLTSVSTDVGSLPFILAMASFALCAIAFLCPYLWLCCCASLRLRTTKLSEREGYG